MNEYLRHYGVIGMKWGVRRYQNKDGTLTDAGRARYGSEASEVPVRLLKSQYKTNQRYARKNPAYLKEQSKSARRAGDWQKKAAEVLNSDEYKRMANSEKRDFGLAFFAQMNYDLSGELLKDLGYKDTDSGRNFVMKNLLGMDVSVREISEGDQ